MGYPREEPRDESMEEPAAERPGRPKKKTGSSVCRSGLCSTFSDRRHGSKGLSAFAVPESFDETRNYEITFWAKNDTNKTQTAIYQKAITDFEGIYPNIRVNLRLYTNYGDIYNDVITNISTGTTPNVCITYPIILPPI